MSLEIEGKVIQVLEEQRGQSGDRSWVRQGFVIEVPGRFPRKLCFDAWGDNVDQVRELSEGDDIKVSFDPESREYNGRWYTNLKAWRIQLQQAGEGQMPGSFPPPMDEPNLPEDDLPF